ncbi:hypothetical protein ACN47A_24510 [Myxococcus fulvus]|uniref:hypothetical protein n=1 Tax=Myxococcus fulvus TaxID=33 RepID=UPI003B9A7E3B
MSEVLLDVPCSHCGHVYSEHSESPCAILVPLWGALTECGCSAFAPMPVGSDFAEPRPWHDCPPCPSCEARCGVPVRLAAEWQHHAAPTDTLVCPACGAGWVGTPDEVAQAERALREWEAEQVYASREVGHA